MDNYTPNPFITQPIYDPTRPFATPTCELYALFIFPSLCSYAISVNALTKRNSKLIILGTVGSCSLLEEIRHGSICFLCS